MKIGIMLTGIGVPPGRERNVSGHVQIPLRTAELLHTARHEVHLIATRQADGTILPKCLPRNCRLHIVTDGRKRGQIGRQNGRNGYRPLRLVQQLWQVRRLAKRLDLDVLHLFGFERMVRLAGLLKLLGTGVPTVATVFSQSPRRGWRPLYRQVDHIITATRRVQNQWIQCGRPMTRAPHGAVRDFRAEFASEGLEAKVPHRVLFWREASWFGGADLCVAAFDRLAPEFPHVTFTFSVRPNQHEVSGIEDVARRHANVELHRFPYAENVSLAQLIVESRCIVLPFRELSIEPQMAVAESLSAGIPVITSNVKSLAESVQHQKNGLVVPSGDGDRLTVAIRQYLSGCHDSLKSGPCGVKYFSERWNWDSYVDALNNVYRSVTNRSIRTSKAA